MGYAFALNLSKFLFRSVPTGAYVHYPTISTDMLDSLNPGSQGVNAGQGTGLRGTLKRIYWRCFASAYSSAGASIDVVMTNSSWTQAHIQKLWGRSRTKYNYRASPIAVVYPPVAVRELEQEIDVSPTSEEQQRDAGLLLYIAQFRPEKNHKLIIQSFAEFVKTSQSEAAKTARLVLVGSVRDDHDSKRVYELRLLVNELHIKDRVEFHLDASWPEILDWLRKASVGVNGMWNEHFGIGVVEYQAAGLVAVVHDSGGPKMDIVVEVDGGFTGWSILLFRFHRPGGGRVGKRLTWWLFILGFHATTSTEFAQAYEKALTLPDPLVVRQRARKSAKRFTEEEFARRWLAQMEHLVRG